MHILLKQISTVESQDRLRTKKLLLIAFTQIALEMVMSPQEMDGATGGAV